MSGKTVKNLWYLFAAYTAVWTALFVYIVYLSQQNKALKEELHNLQAQVAKVLTK